jgi:hypothetical protein
MANYNSFVGYSGYAIIYMHLLIALQDAANTLTVWKNLNLFRNIGAISGWILTVFFPDEDVLYLYLCNMMKYEPATTHALPRY